MLGVELVSKIASLVFKISGDLGIGGLGLCALGVLGLGVNSLGILGLGVLGAGGLGLGGFGGLGLGGLGVLQGSQACRGKFQVKVLARRVDSSPDGLLQGKAIKTKLDCFRGRS